MDGEVLNTGLNGLYGERKSITEICCETCGIKVEQAARVNGKLCPACGGSLVGIRIIRNALTGKILFAERVDL